MSSTLQTGQAAPAFETVDEQGNAVSLASLRGKRVVLYFYPKDDTPGCTKQACAFRDQYADVTAQNAVVLGVSPDTAKKHQKFIQKYELPFPLLLDEDHAIAEAFGVWGERSMYGRKYMGITRSQFIIDEEGNLLDVMSPIKPDQSVPRALEVLGQ
ncbi:MAG: thioredoxin-dependent thiol peroxidase [Myxococcales bacterium]|nr:thioredoxin-dependent thiol peroxidase [Myxococcales bacterium]MCB9642297.1 thioredoxin-dependent thiol peroxidase [Myxococcales bacterium]